MAVFVTVIVAAAVEERWAVDVAAVDDSKIPELGPGAILRRKRYG